MVFVEKWKTRIKCIQISNSFNLPSKNFFNSRYSFFYANYLFEEGKIDKANEVIDSSLKKVRKAKQNHKKNGRGHYRLTLYQI